MKSYTDIEQSRKLAEILPLESADMYWDYDVQKHEYYPMVMDYQFDDTCICAWSLAALLGIASTYCSRLEITLRADKKYNVFAVKNNFVFRSFDDHPDGFDNLIDACYEMILKLNELKML